MSVVRTAFELRYLPLTLAFLGTFLLALLILVVPGSWVWLGLPLLALIGLCALGLHDLRQTKRSVLRNYPISGHARYIMEELRPKIRQYFFEGEKDGRPFPRDKRLLVYQRAKGQLDKRPFGTENNVYEPQYEWISHSMRPVEIESADFRVLIGGKACKAPYSASLVNISAMSFGALSANAIRALNKGAKLGGFAHDTGEGGVSPYHIVNGGDLIWEIGSGYFGCRTAEGVFSPEKFASTANLKQIKMIEIKLSQGAKPGHGGVLPAAKISPEIATIRGISMGEDCISPPAHSEFSTPRELLLFVERLRQLASGKPVGFKLCIGLEHEFLAIVKAMLDTGIVPDFIVVDGTEGGTGAAPAEFTDHVGMPLREALALVHNGLTGAGLRDQVKIGASGMIISAFDIARVLALGADWVNMARGFMFALGCIQSQSCHTDKCPVGVATQDAQRQRAINVPDKGERVRQFHGKTLEALRELVGAAGLEHPNQLRPFHIHRRISQSDVVTFSALYPRLEDGALLHKPGQTSLALPWELADPDNFAARIGNEIELDRPVLSKTNFINGVHSVHAAL